MRFTVTVTLLAFLTACGITGPNGGERAVDARGRYVVGFEANIFVPCRETQSWWVASLDSVPEVQAYLALRRRGGGTGEDVITAFVSWRGIRSAAGHYGHLDGYPYQFDPRATHEVRDTAAADCH